MSTSMGKNASDLNSDKTFTNKTFQNEKLSFTAENTFYNQKNSKSGKRRFGKVAYLLGESSN